MEKRRDELEMVIIPAVVLVNGIAAARMFNALILTNRRDNFILYLDVVV